MKLWEALKALEENPKKRFKSVNYNQEEIIISMGTDCYNLPFRVIDSNRDWQEVKQPVPWQEAIEAWANGKKISVKMPLGDEDYWYGMSINFHKKDITESTWYIED